MGAAPAPEGQGAPRGVSRRAANITAMRAIFGAAARARLTIGARRPYLLAMNMRRNILAAGLVAGLALPLGAQQEAAPDAQPEINPLIELGAQMLLRGLLEEIGPLRLFLDGKEIDLRAYGPPRLLPNGDILIPRKAPAEPEGVGPDAPQKTPDAPNAGGTDAPGDGIEL